MHYDNQYLDHNGLDIQNWLTVQFMIINYTLLNATYNIISRKEVKEKWHTSTDLISKSKEYRTLRQLIKVIGAAKQLQKGIDHKARDTLLQRIRNLQELGKVDIRMWNIDTSIEE